MRIFSKLPSKLDRGLTWRRLRVLFRKPYVFLRNFRFLFTTTTSTEEHIFVVGPPRSGTTLVKNVLRSHPRVTSIDDESFFFFRRNYQDFDLPDLSDDRMCTLVDQADDAVHLFDLLAKEIRQRNGAARFLEKTASHALRLDFILEHFPQSKIIFTLRDVRDGVLSAQRNPAYWSSLNSSDRLRSYVETWRECTKRFIKYEDHDRVRRVRYENLCEDPEAEIRSIMRFLEEPFHERQLRPGAYSQTKVVSQEGHERLGESISGKTVGQWRSQMSSETERRIYNIAEPQLRAVGYPNVG